MAPVRQSDRAFGLTFAAVFSVIGGVGWLVFDARLFWAAGAAGVFLLVALAAPGLLLPLNRLWAKVAAGIGVVTNYLLLGTFFLALVWPLGFIVRRLLGDPMHRRLDPGSDSYWTTVDRQADADTFHDMF